MPGLTAKMH